MRKTLTGIPDDKREELKKIVRHIRSHCAKTEMIILFGSFARGDWTNDRYIEDHIMYEYKSDFDLLIIVRDRESELDLKRWSALRSIIDCDREIRTPTGFVVESIDHVNDQLLNGRYFYADIRKEGVLLYDTGRVKLAEPRKLSPDELRALAEEDLELWTGKARGFFRNANYALKDKDYNLAAFLLHQSTEALFIALALVFTSYRPKTHDLEKLYRRALTLDPRFVGIFPQETDEDKRLFELLIKAYIDARYNRNYAVAEEELAYLAGRIRLLEDLTGQVCREKMAAFTERPAAGAHPK